MLRQEYKDIVRFVVALFVANFVWKYSVTGDDDGQWVALWQRWDITGPFEYMALHIAKVVYTCVAWCRDTVSMPLANAIAFDSGSAVQIVWSCTGIKQSFIWLCILLATAGGWKQKLWYIPLGWLCIYLFNLLRIYLIVCLVEFHPDWFHFLHEYLFKYLFYGMLFVLWVLFVEKIRPKEIA